MKQTEDWLSRSRFINYIKRFIDNKKRCNEFKEPNQIQAKVQIKQPEIYEQHLTKDNPSKNPLNKEIHVNFI